MKITSLKIEPRHSWKAVGEKNPMRAVVKLSNDETNVETIIPDDLIQPLIDLLAGIISEAAQRNVAEFAASCSAIGHDASVREIVK